MEAEVVAVRFAVVLVAPIFVLVVVYSSVAVASLFFSGARRSHALRVMAGLVQLAWVLRPLHIVRSDRRNNGDERSVS